MQLLWTHRTPQQHIRLVSIHADTPTTPSPLSILIPHTPTSSSCSCIVTSKMLLHTSLLAAVTLCCLLAALFALPAPSIAQSPTEHLPTRYLHGWQATQFACSRNPATPYLYYLLDGPRHIAVLDSRDGHLVRNESLYVDSLFYNARIAVDSRDNVFVLTVPLLPLPPFHDTAELKVFDAQLQSVKNITVKSLQPPVSYAETMQLVVDSSNFVYLFDVIERTVPQVWVLSPRQWMQQAYWQAPIPTGNSTRYVLAIDNTDYLYFQQVSGDKNLFITDVKGSLQYTYQLSRGDIDEPDIRDVTIDAQLQMWHTYMNSSAVTVIDSSGRFIADYNLLSMNYGRSNSAIDVDLLNNVVIADRWEQAMLIVSPRGDITRTLSPEVPPLVYVSDLLVDYGEGGGGGGGGGGRGGGSLLISLYMTPYPVQRVSVGDNDAGRLLQRYSLPARLGGCVGYGADIGRQSSNIYLLLACDDIWASSQPTDWLVYVMNKAGRVVSEFHVHINAYRIRVDERAGVVYVSTDNYAGPSYSPEEVIVAYSMMSGSPLANYSTTNPTLGFIRDFTVLPPAGPQSSSTLVVVDPFNLRFVSIDTSGATAPISYPFPNNTLCTNIASSLGQQSTSYYVSCFGISRTSGVLFLDSVFIHKWDVTTPDNPTLTDTFVLPAGVLARLGSLVIGLDQHLYAYDWISSTVWQWRDADKYSANMEPRQQGDAPRIHVGQTHTQLADEGTSDLRERAGLPKLHAQSSHSRRLPVVRPTEQLDEEESDRSQWMQTLRRVEKARRMEQWQ